MVALLAACGAQGPDVPEGAVQLEAGEPVEVGGLTLTAANFGEDSISLIASDGEDYDEAVDLTVGQPGEVKGRTFELVAVEVEGTGDDVDQATGSAWVLPVE
ncbi:hypothetical protein [Cellulomonas sp. S1-8]|uniref:hypothetical protein n=1 Tax=Cellulomonas sp. S1-8 TaxID=2904790 RepID=UPI0022433FBE|nr:hypothetical protein [Cellulomonas sp. S1-8]UZN02264.1 hypothetical protein OKX07_14355 [Cellulomonas sp. S1-8]